MIYQGSGKIIITGCSKSSFTKYFDAAWDVGEKAYIKYRAKIGVLESVFIKKIKVNDFSHNIPILAYVDMFNRVWLEHELIDLAEANELINDRIEYLTQAYRNTDACEREEVYALMKSRLPNYF